MVVLCGNCFHFQTVHQTKKVAINLFSHITARILDKVPIWWLGKSHIPKIAYLTDISLPCPTIKEGLLARPVLLRGQNISLDASFQGKILFWCKFFGKGRRNKLLFGGLPYRCCLFVTVSMAKKKRQSDFGCLCFFEKSKVSVAFLSWLVSLLRPVLI